MEQEYNSRRVPDGAKRPTERSNLATVYQASYTNRMVGPVYPA